MASDNVMTCDAETNPKRGIKAPSDDLGMPMAGADSQERA
jgi:hypothetical protein